MKKAQKFWDKQAKRYDKSEKQFESIYQDIIARTKEYLNVNDTVLDYGCATGTKTLALAERIKHIHGLDISGEMIKEAIKKKNDANINNAAFSEGTIFDSDLKTASYEKIIAFGIIHLLNDSDKAIHKIHELLKPGGTFISTTACFKDKMSLSNRMKFTMYLLMKRLGIFPLHLNMFKMADVVQLINSQNFNIVKAEKIFKGMTISFIVAEKQGTLFSA